MFVFESLALFALIWWIATRCGRRIAASSRASERADLHACAWLRQRLAGQVPVPVHATWWNAFGDKIRFDLGEVGVFQINCLWPRPVDVVSILGARFNDRIGWVIDARSANGDPVRFYAWKVRHRPQ